MLVFLHLMSEWRFFIDPIAVKVGWLVPGPSYKYQKNEMLVTVGYLLD